jgi:hypothetical protein
MGIKAIGSSPVQPLTTAQAASRPAPAVDIPDERPRVGTSEPALASRGPRERELRQDVRIDLPARTSAPSSFRGPVIDPAIFPARDPGESDDHYQRRLHDFGVGFEDRYLAQHGPGLCSYGPFDPSREPVILVHGIHDSPGDMIQMAERLRSEGRQVLFFCYEDLHDGNAESGAALARELSALRAAYPRDRAASLDIVAHSMGGLVTRSAFSSLSSASSEASRRAGFSEIAVTTLDTPLAGAPEGLPGILATISNMDTYHDMGSSSAFFRDLRTMPLPGGVSFSHVPASQAAGSRDGHLWLEDLSPQELSYIGPALAQRDLESFSFERAPGPHTQDQLRNIVLALREDSRWPLLCERLARVTDGAAVLRIVQDVIPPIAGTHREMLFRRDALDTVSRSVRRDR